MTNKSLNAVKEKSHSAVPESALLFGIKEEDKIEKFEGLLSEAISTSDSIKEAIAKMVKAALTVEFGEDLLQKKEAEGMVRAISAGIYGDGGLRRQALIIMDRFARPGELNA